MLIALSMLQAQIKFIYTSIYLHYLQIISSLFAVVHRLLVDHWFDKFYYYFILCRILLGNVNMFAIVVEHL